MIIYRITKGAYKNDLSGLGAQKSGGRWISKGGAMVYTSGSQALCMLEVAVHIPLHLIPDDYWLISIEVPDSVSVLELEAKSLPADWKFVPPAFSTQQIGDGFLKDGAFAVLKVPSVLVPGEFNYLLNPEHNMMKNVKVVAAEPVVFDGRLFR